MEQILYLSKGPLFTVLSVQKEKYNNKKKPRSEKLPHFKKKKVDYLPSMFIPHLDFLVKLYQHSSRIDNILC